jgi:acetyl-CoA synthetase
VVKSAGYRIGPSELENCLVKHAAFANAAVVPTPDAERGKLAPYEYPKEIEFLDALPMTTTGKVQRLREEERKQNRR